MGRVKFAIQRRPKTKGKRSRKPKRDQSSTDDLAASAKKIRLDQPSTSSYNENSSALKRPNGYRFQDQNILKNVIAEAAVCSKCLKGKLQLWEKPNGCGLARTSVLLCSNIKCKNATDLPTSEKKCIGKSRFYDVNRRSKLAMRLIGRGRAALVKFTAVMNMPGPVKKKSFATHVSRIAKVSKLVAEADMKKTGNCIRKEIRLKKDEIMDLSVSCDGTWARRGYQSLYGMVSAIHVESGKILDFETKSKVCYKCRAKQGLDHNSQLICRVDGKTCPLLSSQFFKVLKGNGITWCC